MTLLPQTIAIETPQKMNSMPKISNGLDNFQSSGNIVTHKRKNEDTLTPNNSNRNSSGEEFIAKSNTLDNFQSSDTLGGPKDTLTPNYSNGKSTGDRFRVENIVILCLIILGNIMH